MKHKLMSQSILCAVIYLYIVQIMSKCLGSFYEKVRHVRAEAKSLFHKAGCGTSEIHYGLREVQHREDHSKLEWRRSEDKGGGCANGKGKKMAFSSKVQREMSISVIPTRTITSKTKGQRVFSRESMRTSMKLVLSVFLAHDQRSIVFCPKYHLAGKK